MAFGILIAVVLSQSAPSLSQGRAHVEALRKPDLVKTWSKIDGIPGQQFGSLAALQKFAAGFRSYGTESKLVSEGLADRGGLTVYTRVMAVSNWARGITIDITMDPKGRLLNAVMNFASKEAPTTYGAYRSLVKLRLPLEETWHVLWGGRTWDDNRHASMSDMRFALDLLQRKNGSSQATTGLKNEDFFAWNQPVVAPADGVVVVADDGVVDNLPNKPAGGNLYGNLIVIDHGTDEYTLLGHLKQGSLLVKVGERVTQGQRLARVGNSGMSTEPHLHFHLMDTADWHTANGLPLQLHDFVRNGTLVDRAEPRRGDILTAVRAEASR
jgi:hypothetical protein